MANRDNRFGRFKFGTSHKFGASSFDMPALAWDISIDWDGDGIFEVNESNLMTAIHIKRGRTRLLKSQGVGLENIPTGTASITLRNRDGRFDGWNQDSPLYPNVGAKKDVRIRVRPLDGSTVYPLFYGQISNVNPSGANDRNVTISVRDGLDVLRNATARVSMQQNIAPGAAMALILAAAKWKPAWGSSLDTSVETIPYWWASGNKRAMSELEDLAASFLGYFFCDARGRARFVDRGTVGDVVANFEQADLLKDIGNPQPSDVQRDVTRIKVHPRTQAATGVIWQLIGSIPSIVNGDKLKIFVNYTYANAAAPAINVQTPAYTGVPGTSDILCNSQSDGAGTDLTGSCPITFTDFGDTGLLVIQNNSGSTVHVVKAQVQGDAIYEVNASDVTYPAEIEDAESLREMILDLPWQQDFNSAVDIANVLGAFYAGLHPMPSTQYENRFDKQFVPDLFDIVTGDLPKLGLVGESFRVGGIEHKSINTDNCQSIRSRFWLEPYVAAGNYMQWDTNSVWNTSTIFGW